MKRYYSCILSINSKIMKKYFSLSAFTSDACITYILIFLFISFLSIQSNAQLVIKSGLNLSNIYEKYHGPYNTYGSMIPGFHFSLSYDLPSKSFLAFEPGLLLTTKGIKYEYRHITQIPNEDFSADVTIKLFSYYLDIPLKIKAYYGIGERITLFGLIGPYVGIGLHGKVKMVKIYDGGWEEKEQDDIEWGNKEDEIWRPDAGLTFGIGIEFRSFIVEISNDLEMFLTSAYSDHSTQNRVLKFSLGYSFGK